MSRRQKSASPKRKWWHFVAAGVGGLGLGLGILASAATIHEWFEARSLPLAERTSLDINGEPHAAGGEFPGRRMKSDCSALTSEQLDRLLDLVAKKLATMEQVIELADHFDCKHSARMATLYVGFKYSRDYRDRIIRMATSSDPEVRRSLVDDLRRTERRHAPVTAPASQ